MRSGTGISSVNDGKVAYTQEEAKEKHRGGDRSRDKRRAGHRNRNTSTCGCTAEARRERGTVGLPPCPPLPIICYMSPPSDEGNPCLDRDRGRAPA